MCLRAFAPRARVGPTDIGNEGVPTDYFLMFIDAHYWFSASWLRVAFRTFLSWRWEPGARQISDFVSTMTLRTTKEKSVLTHAIVFERTCFLGSLCLFFTFFEGGSSRGDSRGSLTVR